ncbi:MAG: hypothetical protein ABSD75_15340 [Terriglobales bacterium]|jgi:hypothetical protein
MDKTGYLSPPEKLTLIGEWAECSMSGPGNHSIAVAQDEQNLPMADR